MQELLEAISSFDAEGALFTTFTMDPTFFEQGIAQPLLRRRHECRIFLLADRWGFQNFLNERSALWGAGSRYWAAPVDAAPFRFHPKVSLLWGPNGVRLVVASANMTRAGYGGNLEIADILEAGRGNHGDRNAIVQAMDWFEALAARVHLPQAAVRHLAGEVASARKALPGPAGAPPGQGITSDGCEEPVFLHNLDQSILDQMVSNERIIEAVKRIVVISPFHDADHSLLNQLAARCPDASIAVYQGPEGRALNPKVPAALRNHAKPGTCSAQGPDDHIRRLHGKVVLLVGAQSAVLVTGSANLTTPGMGMARPLGNVEAVVARVCLGNPDAFEEIFQGAVRLQPGAWDSLVFEPPKAPQRAPSGPVIRWAESNGRNLRLELAGLDDSDRTPVRGVEVLGGPVRVPLPIPATATSSEGRLTLDFTLDSGEDDIFDGPTVVEALLRAGASCPYLALRCLVISPGKIASSFFDRSARKVANGLRKGEPLDSHLEPLLALLQDEVARLATDGTRLVGLGPGHHQGGGRGLADITDVADVEECEGRTNSVAPLGVGGSRSTEAFLDLLKTLNRFADKVIHDPGAGFPSTVDDAEDPDDPDAVSDTEDIEDEDEGTEEGGGTSDGGSGRKRRGLSRSEVVEALESFVDRQAEVFAEPLPVSVLRFGPMAQLIRLSLTVARVADGLQALPSADGLPIRCIRNTAKILQTALSQHGQLWQAPRGWFARAALGRRDDVRAALTDDGLLQLLVQCLMECAGAPEGPETDDPWRLDAERGRLLLPVLGTVERVLGGSLEERAGTDDARAAMVLAAIRSVESLENQALRRFRPLVAYMHASRRVADGGKERLVLAEEVQSLRDDIKAYTSSRNKNLKAKAARLAELETRLADVTAGLVAERAAQATSLQQAMDAAPDEARILESAVKKNRLDALAMVTDPGQTTCPACNLAYPPAHIARARSLARGTTCPWCKRLVVPVPERALLSDDDGLGAFTEGPDAT